MSTLDLSNFNIRDPDEQTNHSESEMHTIGDLVVWHQMPFLSVRRLTQLNCARWCMWDSCNIARISKVRTLDDTRDWYFPIIVKKKKETYNLQTENAHPSLWTLADQPEEDSVSSLPFKDVWSSWSGIWHSSAQHASESALPLPPMTHLPHEWLHFSNPRDDIIASAGGLLLIKGQSGVVPIRRSKRLSPALAGSNRSSISDTTKQAADSLNEQLKNRKAPSSWKRLLVCNPLTRECRELPAADCLVLGLPSWECAYMNGVQASLVVDEEANCYQVILTLRDFVAVYKSTTNTWNCLRFLQERPWRRRLPSRNLLTFVKWEYICASAQVGGRLYFADVRSTTASNPGMEPIGEANDAATLRLFEVNAEEGKWQVVHEYTLRKFHIPALKSSNRACFYDMNIIPYVEILECMGSLYAVLPAKVHDGWLIGGSEQPRGEHWKWKALKGEPHEYGRRFGYMPLCFYIMQLEGDGVNCGVLRIRVPLIHYDFHYGFRRLMTIACENRWCSRNWFSCEARGSLIWVEYDDFLLSFDVMSLESKTQIVDLHHGSRFGEEKLGFAYRPSLHMKP